MTDKSVSLVPAWGIPRINPGYIYIVHVGERLKIGKSKDRASRIRAAKTWLPDMTLIGVKPFWLVDRFEKDLHEGLARGGMKESGLIQEVIHILRTFCLISVPSLMMRPNAI